MFKLLRRLVWWCLLTGGAVLGYLAWKQRREVTSFVTPATSTPATAGDEQWPQFEAPVAAAAWVAPIDGACPDGYPIKANDNSGIFHLPGGRFYARTVPERCYSTAEAAEADGYRRAKS